ncbi:Probable U3 small nucleolar RNA-associated protein 18 [Taphrina deformans PYCC 5710]|uniref:Probable U3 small nucleolar RNA-associated protein 18 n=1 Tax=Taphrina deformans (strain PYCC 5710 / ATCC 11124 / CBS 356.35 / IMI 108563 / JCM 9778 / NBRC 8474) TaxID=1097556 RepID=R4XFY6_TAPDE|nr:Probable U3 small nucleolar RNA-associated protein 18 [Taphrina deformans PYCC 5710]|eukprot:CCG83409.1 Probable U3 small nucleolar RNA-associated protein 18 [Taphrina deformans PYCC 5710]
MVKPSVELGAKTAVEKRLELAVFGDDNFNDRFDESDPGSEVEESEYTPALDGENDYEAMQDDQLFMVDDGTLPMEGVEAPTPTKDDDAANACELAELRPAVWHDSDDEKLQISLASAPRLRKLRRTEAEDAVNGTEYVRRLRTQFERVYPIPDWALPPKKRRRARSIDSDASSSDLELNSDAEGIAMSADPLKALLRSSQSYAKTRKTSVRAPAKLDIKRLRDANHQAPSASAIQTLSFHPSYPLMMTGGYDRTLRVYHIDGKLNTPASSLYLKKVPIESAEFHPDGRRVFIGGKRKYFHIWDLETGAVEKVSRTYGHEGMQSSMVKLSLSKSGEYLALVGSSGWVNLLSATTGQWLDAFKITRGVSDLVWHADGNLTVANIGAELWEYSVAHRRVVRTWTDDGGMSTTKIAVGGQGDRWFAVGSKSGIVNVYDRTQDASAQPKAYRTLKHITVAVHCLAFSGDGQILAMAGRAKKDVLKMVHLPTATVYQNWPTQNTPLGKIGSLAFSPGAEMFAVGNEVGRVTLWSI